MVVNSPFLIACGDAAKLLVSVDQPLNLVALAVAGAVEGAGTMLIRLPRHGDANTMAPAIPADLATAIRLATHQTVWPGLRPASALTLHAAADHQLGKDGGLMPLAWRQQPREELAGPFRPEVDFRAEAASAPPERFGLGIPFFAPAAC